jgi:hypothetical protein
MAGVYSAPFPPPARNWEEMKWPAFRKSFFLFEEGWIEEDRLRLFEFPIKSKGIGIEDEDPS